MERNFRSQLLHSFDCIYLNDLDISCQQLWFLFLYHCWVADLKMYLIFFMTLCFQNHFFITPLQRINASDLPKFIR